MKNRILALAAVLVVLPMTVHAAVPRTECIEIMSRLLDANIVTYCSYTPIEGMGNTWIIGVKSSSYQELHTMTLVYGIVLTIDKQIPEKTSHIAIMLNGTNYFVPMQEVRQCRTDFDHDAIKIPDCFLKHTRS